MDLTVVLIVGLACVALPVLILLLIVRCIMHIVNKKTEVMLAAIEKTPDVDMAKLKIGLGKSERERLLNKLMYGSIVLLAGLSVLAVAALMCPQIQNIVSTVMCGAVMVAVGCALVITYFVGRRQMKGGGVQR